MRLFGDNPLLIIQTYPILCWFNIYRASWRRNWDAEGVWSQAAVAGAPPEGRDWKKTLAVLSGVSHYVPWFTPMVLENGAHLANPCAFQDMIRTLISHNRYIISFDSGNDMEMSSQPQNVPTKMRRGLLKNISHKDLAPGFGVARRHMCKKKWSRDAISKCLRFFHAQARNMGHQQKAEKSTTIRDGHWSRRHLPIVIEIHLEVHHIPYQMQPIISLRLGPKNTHSTQSWMLCQRDVIYEQTHTNTYIYIYTNMAPCQMAANSFLYKPVAAPGAPWSHSTPHPRGQTDAPPSASVGPQWAPGSDHWMRQPAKT